MINLQDLNVDIYGDDQDKVDIKKVKGVDRVNGVDRIDGSRVARVNRGEIDRVDGADRGKIDIEEPNRANRGEVKAKESDKVDRDKIDIEEPDKANKADKNRVNIEKLDRDGVDGGKADVEDLDGLGGAYIKKSNKLGIVMKDLNLGDSRAGRQKVARQTGT